MRDPLARVRIRNKLPLTFLAICLVAFGIGGVVLTSEARAALEDQIAQRLDERAVATALIVERHLDLYSRRVEDFASDGHIRDRLARLTRALADGDVDAAKRERQELGRHLAENKLSLAKPLVGAVLYAADGRPLVVVPPVQNAGTRTPGPTIVGPVEPASDTYGYPTFRITTGISSLLGRRPIGVLAIVVRADAWIETMRELDTLPAMPLRAQTLIVENDVRLPLAPGGRDEPSADDTWRRQIANSGWSVALAVDRASAMAPARRLVEQYFWIGVGLFVLIAGVMFFPVRFLLQPLSDIGEAARKIGEGDFSARVEHESGDEIGDLAHAFNVMADAVGDRTKRLEHAAQAVKQSEQEIRLERNRLNTVIRSMEDGLFILDAQGRVTLSNAAARPLVEALSGEKARQLECARLSGKVGCMACIAETERGHQSCTVEQGGRIYDVHTTTLPTGKGQRPSRLCVSRDVTERIDIREREAHQERLAVLGEIAAVMAHELNNPLAAISMFAQMLEEQLEDGSTSAESAGVIMRNVEACKRTIHGLLDLAGRGHVETAAFDFHELIADVHQFLKPVAQRAGVILSTELAAERTTLTADPVRLRQVLVNLVMNAIQASGPDGHVALRTFETDETLGVDVVDTGSGVPEEVRARIFEPFFTTKGAGSGTGLGLSTSRRIAEEHGGRLTLEASGTGGSEFRFVIPRRSALRRWEREVQLATDVATPRQGRRRSEATHE